MFSSIVLNALIALYFFAAHGRKTLVRSTNLIPLALLITVFGDLFLTLLGGPQLMLPGVICFCIVETIYAVYLKSTLASIILRACILMALCIGAALTNNISVLNIAAIVDISVLACNVIDAWRAKKMDPGMLFKLGITLFFFCDLCVGLSSLLDGTIGSVVSFMIWVFYIPSQVLITLSYAKRSKQI